MDEHAFDQMLSRLMKQDLAAGTEAFRDSLLERCLAVLGEDDGNAFVEDADLELLAAAGASPAPGPIPLEPRDAIGHNGSGDLLA